MDDYLDEHEKWEWLKGWFKENIPWILAGIAVGGVAVGGWRWYGSHVDQKGMAAGAMYDQIADAFQKSDNTTALEVPFTLAPRLVRGLDYYTRTTFEFASDALESAQNAVGGGGRYDGLAESLGAPPTPGIGFGTGIERVLLACDAEGVFPVQPALVDVFVIDTTGGDAARDITAELRGAGVSADRAFDNRSWKAQLKAAQRSGARLAVAVEADGIQLRTLTEKGEPEPVDRATLVDHVRKRL
jgi:histidyl-tRNA synthetase